MIWYPAERSVDRRLTFRDYIRSPGDQDAGSSAAAMRDYRATFGRDSSAALLPESLTQFLESPSGAIRNAAPLPGRHPALLLQTGLNAPAYLFSELAESLAASGFVVATLASFGHAEGVPLALDSSGVATQVADIRHAAQWLSNQAFVDPGRIGIGGWSVGAVSALVYAGRSPTGVRALVSLDGGLGYEYGGSLAKQHGVRLECVRTPLLHMSGTQESAFRVAKSRVLFDALPRGDAFWATIPGLGHADFTSHMGSRSPLLHTREDRAEVMAGTRRMERALRAFLGRYLAGNVSLWPSAGPDSIEAPAGPERGCVVSAPTVGPKVAGIP